MFVLDNKSVFAMVVIMILLGVLLFVSGFVGGLMYLDSESAQLLALSNKNAERARAAKREMDAPVPETPAAQANASGAAGAADGAAQGVAGAADSAKASAAGAGLAAKDQTGAIQAKAAGAAGGAQDQAGTVAAGAKDQAGTAAAGAKDQAGTAAAGATDQAGTAAAGATDQAGTVAAGAKDQAGAAKDQAAAAAAGATDKAGTAAAGATDQAGTAAAGAKDQAGAAAAGATDKAAAAKDVAGSKVEALSAAAAGTGNAATSAVAALLGGKAPAGGAAKDAAASPEAAAGGDAAAGGAGDYLVQVGSFLGKQNADKLAHLLLDKGYPSGVMTRIDDRERTWFMVYVGRYPDKNAAQGAAEKIRSEENVGAIVIRAATSAAARYEPLKTVYSVQVGSFLSEGVGLHMVRELKAKGFDACYYHLFDDADKQWYVVQVGDFEDKKDALAAAKVYETRQGTAPSIKSLAAELLTERKQCP